jgi:AcrR family transcriptional regulator
VSIPADPGSADGVRALLGLAPGQDVRADAGTKGGRTREAILTAGVALACRTGLGGLTISTLAADVGMSKSGMFAHFGSKEALQLAVVETAAREFATEVVIPALHAPRGEPRVLALLEGWLECGLLRRPGGCLFVKASTELDEQPGPVRDRLRDLHLELAGAIARIFVGGIAQGHFRADADPEQFAVDLHAVMLGFYHQHRMLADPRAADRARAAVAALLTAARPTPQEQP